MRFLSIIFNDSTGGEGRIFRDISEHYRTEKLVLFSSTRNEISDAVIYPVRFLLNALIRLDEDLGVFTSSIISSLFLRRSYLNGFDIVFFNSSSIAFPPFKNMITILYTPPRALTDRYPDSLELIKARNCLLVPLFRIGSKILNVAYKASVCDRNNLICISANVRERLKKYYGADCLTVPLFINVVDHRNSSFSNFFLYVSRITPGKRQHLAIEAFKLFCDSKGNFRFVIAGTTDSTEHSRRYLEELRNISLGYPIEFVLSPSDDTVRDLYSNCYLTLFTAKNEDFGLAPLESMASGKPVIALNEGGPKETIINGTTGFLVDDIAGMAERMVYLADNIDENISMGKRGREHVEKNFSPESFYTKIDALIQSVLRKDKK